MRRLLCVLALSLALSARAGIETEREAVPASFAHAATALDSLREDILANRIGSSEALLQFLATTPAYRDWVRNPVLLEKSEARHGGEVSPEFPRILLHHGDLTLHLTGDPRGRGRSLIEVMQYLPSQGRFLFGFINFGIAATHPDRRVITDAMTLEDAHSRAESDLKRHLVLTPLIVDRIKTINANHASMDGLVGCNYCHGRHGMDVLPAWSLGNHLHKAYGKGDDTIPAGTAEHEAFRKFLAIRQDPDRGRLYRWLKLEMETAPNGDLRFPARPNATFTQALHRENRHRIGKMLSDSPAYRRLEPAVVGAFFDCANIESFLPAAYRAAHEAKLREFLDRDHSFAKPIPVAGLVDALAAHVRKINAGFRREREGKIPARLRTVFEREIAHFESDAYLQPLAKLRYLLEGRVRHNYYDREVGPYGEVVWSDGEPIRYWFLDTNTMGMSHSYFFPDGAEGLRELLATELGAGFRARHPALDLFDGDVKPASLRVPLARYCERLRDESLRALSEGERR